MSADFASLDVFLRGGTVTALVLCAVLFALRPVQRRKGGAVVSLAVGLCAYLLVSTPHLPFSSGGVAFVLVLVAGAVPVLVYWVATELFLDDAAFSPAQVIVCVATVLCSWVALYVPALGVIRGVLVIALLAHLLMVIISGDAADLIEPRRRFRRWFALAMVGLCAVITIAEVLEADRGMPDFMFVLHAAVFLVLTAAFLIWAAQIAPGIWLISEASPRRRTGLDPAQTVLVARARRAMADGAWREEGLTISALANRLNSQEHKLRHAINQGLGFRNFAQFINGYRIAAAQEMLADPQRADQTVLSIAYEVGFASLGPFNRAFRAVTGQTPTEYRRDHLRAAAARTS